MCKCKKCGCTHFDLFFSGKIEADWEGENDKKIY